MRHGIYCGFPALPDSPRVYLDGLEESARPIGACVKVYPRVSLTDSKSPLARSASDAGCPDGYTLMSSCVKYQLGDPVGANSVSCGAFSSHTSYGFFPYFRPQR